MTTIRYFLPEDGDSEDHPNVFLAPKSRTITLAQIKQAFPLPGRYHFRFKAPLVPGGDREKGAMAVWMDLTDDRALIPTWKAHIVAKVTRIAVEEEEDDDTEVDDHHGHFQTTTATSTQQATATQSQTHQQHHHQQQPSLDLFDSQPARTAPTQQQQHHHATDNLLDIMNYSNTSSTMQQQQQQHHADFLGMTTAQATTSPPLSGNHTSYPQQHQHSQYSAPNSGNYGQPFGDLGTPWK